MCKVWFWFWMWIGLCRLDVDLSFKLAPERPLCSTTAVTTSCQIPVGVCIPPLGSVLYCLMQHTEVNYLNSETNMWL